MNTRIVNGIVYLLVTDKSKEIYTSGLFELYILINQNVVTWVDVYSDLDTALEQGYDIGIEVGSFANIVKELTK
jgi:hypothetical protein